ncbi:MAG: hypothetical protein K9G76_08780 [Bacteroidales bacterium]|nr:hypothetical protein [Bacteroidales bacterium]MCF8404460.1 hypothetical protein [Bacteroidales bacterium]
MSNSNKSKANKTAKSLQSILGGGFLTRDKTARNLPFIMFLAFIAILYIGNSYYAEKNIRKIERLQKEIKELRYEHIYTKSKLMSKSRQSEVAESLSDRGIKESMVPPKKIKIEKDN